MFSPHCVLRCVPNEIDYGKINVEANSGTAVYTRMNDLIDMQTLRNIDVPLVSSYLTLTRFDTFS